MECLKENGNEECGAKNYAGFLTQKKEPDMTKISRCLVSHYNAGITRFGESSGVLQRLIEGNDLTLYGLSNAVTRHSQDVPDYDRATALEGIGYNILSMPAGQWSRINQMAA